VQRITANAGNRAFIRGGQPRNVPPPPPPPPLASPPPPPGVTDPEGTA
jgi:hypothetical protein